MGLDEFVSRDGNSDRGEDSNTDLSENSGGGRGHGGKQIVRSGGESDAHFNAKSYLAATLHNAGFEVETEHSINIADSCSVVVCDVYAETTFNGNTVKIAGEVGHYDHNRASKALDVVDVILWAGKDFKENEIVVIEDKSVTGSMLDVLPDVESDTSSHIYIDESGKEFIPDISSINVRYYEEVANHILMNVLDMREHNVNSITEMVRSEFDDGEEPNRNDISRVLSAMGYIQE